MSLFITTGAVSAKNDTFVRGVSPAIGPVNFLVEEISRTDIPILLMGESGSGKEVYGRMIHRLSINSHLPLKKVNCRAVEQRELLALKSELRGRVEPSAGKPQSLFLDGIDELDLENQKILLSFLPDGEIGDGNSNRMRLIASTTRNLEKEVEAGRFRRELYFRINGVCLRLPPLRDRKEDIQPFVRYFLAKYAAELGREAPPPSDSEMDVLTRHDWPGNVRELENLTKRIVLLGNSSKPIQELGETLRLEPGHREEPAGISLKAVARTASRRAERDLIAKALAHTRWNRKRAAQQLQISYKSLLYKIKQAGLEEEQKEEG